MTRSGKAGPAARGSTTLQSAILAGAGVGTLLLLWTALIQFSVVPEESLPYPVDVVQRLPSLVTENVFLTSLGDTMFGWIASLLIASAAAVVVGLVLCALPWLDRPVTLVVDVFRSIPATALIPLAILAFGLGMEMKVSLAAYAAFWIVLINTIYGVQGVEPMRRDAARSMQWNWWRTQLFVIIPSALPSIVTGIRIASGTALVVVLSAELLGAKSGLGTLMVQYQQALQIDAVFGLLLTMGVIGSALYGLLILVEKRSMKWVHHA